MLLPAWAQLVAMVEWVCTTPDPSNALWSQCASASEEGLRSPSTVCPGQARPCVPASSVIGHAARLDDDEPAFLSMPLTFPQVNMTRPCLTSSRFALKPVLSVPKHSLPPYTAAVPVISAVHNLVHNLFRHTVLFLPLSISPPFCLCPRSAVSRRIICRIPTSLSPQPLHHVVEALHSK